MVSLRWHCHDSYHGMPQGCTAGGIAIVIDVLRASTTIVAALERGAAAVLPTSTIEHALAVAATEPVVLGGERGGVRIAGFDLGNSPWEYTAAAVGERRVVITTTNGTQALGSCRDAAAVLIGALVNRSAVVRGARAIARRENVSDIHLVCAGTDGFVTEEDLLAAGAMLEAGVGPADTLDAAALSALKRYRDTVADRTLAHPEALLRAMKASRGGRNLLELGMQADLPAAAAIDTSTTVPLLDAAGWLVAATFPG